MTPGSFSYAHRMIAMLAALAALAVAQGDAFAHGAGGVCERWPEDRLIIGDLEGRRFDLQASGPIDEAPRFDVTEERTVLHRSFRLFVDAAEPIALFRSPSPKTLIFARDRERREPLIVPVFFVGRRLQSHADLLSDTELAAFAPSGRLHDGQEFSAIQFHLRSGGSRFSDIRPFLACGLAGLLLCEGTCPGDSAVLASSLVTWKLSGARAETGAAEGTRFFPVHEGCAQAPSPALGACDPFAAPVAPFAKDWRGDETSAQAAPVKPLPRIHFNFESPSGTAIPVQDVLAAEGKISVDGIFLEEMAEELGAALPKEAVRKLKSLEAASRLFPHYQVSKLRQEGSRTVLVMEPLFVRAAGLRLAIADGAGHPVSGCRLALQAEPSRQVGEGWTERTEELAQGITFRERDGAYQAVLPAGVAENGLLISIAPQGKVARLVSESEACALEAKPDVTADEVKSGLIRRSLRTTGAVLIALFSTDGDLSRTADLGAVRGFWSSALDLAGAISDARWERKLLARAQSFGPVPETRLLQRVDGEAKLAEGETRKSMLTDLVEGSKDHAPLRAILNGKPLERFHLDLALEPLRGDAGLDPFESKKQESLLLITGGGGLRGSYFCREPLPGGESLWSAPAWLDQTRKLFAVEVWAGGEAESLQREGHAAAVIGAPEGVYRCIGRGSEDAAIELYGLAPATLASPVREATFAYLTAKAKTFLRP